MSGYLLRHALELYARAGIPPPDVLRMATLTPAQVVGVDRDLGVIAEGKMQTWWKISPLDQGAGAAASNPPRNNGTITRAVAKSWLLDPIGLFAQPVT